MAASTETEFNKPNQSDYVRKLEREIVELKAKIQKLEKPDIFWLVGNPEDGMDSAESLVDQLIDSDSTGEVFELEVACRLPNIKVKVLHDSDSGSLNLEYL